MLKEFKAFAMKGNIIDLAVGVIIGGAFQKIVTSLVNDIIMPIISIFTGNTSLNNLSITIGNATIKYGDFLVAVIDFLFIAFTIFLIIKYFNRINKKFEQLTAKQKEKIEKIKEKERKRLEAKGIIVKAKAEEPVPAPTTKVCPYCLSEINIKATRCPFCTSELDNK